MAEKDCLFCKIIRGEIQSPIVRQDDLVVAFRDIQPQAPHHLLVCPRKHIATLNDLTSEDEAAMGRAVAMAASLAAEAGVAREGYRLVINCERGAGQSIFHLHAHVLGGRPFGWPPG
ncbi:MAG TPA: histidine triad nucleotide-binding protein [Candidatus Polarisedimenticolia bacterium]|nr:histidine triad nucleotide-binding protein [Candidatus Polarisedimenticolia bacterium]